MVNVYKRKCRTESCGVKPSLGVAGTETAKYCTQHAPEGMVKVYNKKCKTETCGKKLSFGVAATKMAQCCTQNAPEGMVKVYNKTCRTKTCGKEPSFGVTNTRTAVYYAQHATLPCGVDEYREREVSPHHSGKETIGNVIPSGAPNIQRIIFLSPNPDNRRVLAGTLLSENDTQK